MTEYSPASRSHPSPDELADLRADALADARLAEVSSHVASCPQCASELAAIDDVQALLVDAGNEPIAMPADVAAAIEAALATASLERASGIPSLAERRTSGASHDSASPGRDHGSLWRKLAVAAAVVVVGGSAVAGLTRLEQGDDNVADAGSAADSGGAELGRGGGTNEENLDGESPTSRIKPQRVTEDNLTLYAQALSDQPAAGYSGPRLPLPAERACPSVDLSGNALRTPVRFEGRLAYVLVKRGTREVSVYSCDSPPERLYRTSY